VKAAQGILVVPTTGRGYAPATFQGIPEADGLNRKALAAAMERLFSSGRIKVENKGSASRPQNQIVRCDRV